MKTTVSNLPVFCTDYFDLMDKNPNHFCKEQHALREIITREFDGGKIYADMDLYEKHLRVGEYLGFKSGYEWERLLIGLFLCTFWKDTGDPRWPETLVFMGRGNGKDGILSWVSTCLIGPNNPIHNYDVDICAFNEDQSKRSVDDIRFAFEMNEARFRKHFYWTKEMIKGLKNKGRIKPWANSSKNRDGLRSGAVFFNEIHTYPNFDNINVFTSGLGKRKHPRIGYFTTNGYIVGGPLDELLELSKGILFENAEDDGLLPFIFKLDDLEEVHDPENWIKANPSLPYKPELLKEMKKEYKKWVKAPTLLTSFITKRMNIRVAKEECPVAQWEQIERTNKPIPYEELKGRDCTVGIDLAETTDWVGVNIHFKDGDMRTDINKAWVCLQSKDLWRLKCPYKEWAERGDLILVDAPEISPDLIAEYLVEIRNNYNIRKICLDNHRFSVIKDALNRAGISTDKSMLKLYRPSDIMQVIPVVNRCFVNDWFIWGNTPHLRWACNNTKLIPAKKSALTNEETDIGNFLYGKIESKSRKTDPFIALVASMIVEDEIRETRKRNIKRVKVKTF